MTMMGRKMEAIEKIQTKPLEMKHIVSEMKNILDGKKNILHTEQENVSTLGDIIVETIQ